MIVIGGSFGGMNALRKILRGLPEEFPLPVAVVLHRHKDSDDSLVGILQRDSKLRTHEVIDKDSIRPGCVYLGPSDYHLLVEPMYFSLSTDEPVQYARPSIDVLFSSAADAFGSQVIGVVLSGANHDGASGAREIRQRGGVVIVQDPLTAESAVMPEAALETVPDAIVKSPADMASLLVKLAATDLHKPLST